MSKTISLRPYREFQFPVIAECITTDIFQDKTCEEIGQLKIWEGNKQKKLGELFKIEDVRAETQGEGIMIQGNVSAVRGIGSHMTRGEIVVHGGVGMHLGEEMNGGKITVHGDVGGWAGSMMKDGTITIYGNVGDYLAAPYRGSSQGMNKGRITVYGNVGNEAGAHMKRGIIKIHGNVGQFVGFHMHDGTIYVQKDCAGRAGARMVNGKIIIGGFLESVLPTFTIDSIKAKVKIEEKEIAQGTFYVFLGDMAEDGNGKLYVSKDRNPHLGSYERFL